MIKNPTNRNLKILHKRLWLWLAENPHKQKYQWPGWNAFNRSLKFDISISNDCFACQEASIRGSVTTTVCKSCPISWSSGHCNGFGGEFHVWVQATTFAEKSALATKIANLYWSDKGARRNHETIPC